MARALDPPVISAPSSRHSLYGLSNTFQHITSEESAPQASKIRSSTFHPRAQSKWPVIFSLLAVVAITLACFRIFHRPTKVGSTQRQLGDKLPKAEEDPELSEILEMCLDMEQERGHLLPFPAFQPQEKLLFREGIYLSSQHEQREQRSQTNTLSFWVEVPPSPSPGPTHRPEWPCGSTEQRLKEWVSTSQEKKDTLSDEALPSYSSTLQSNGASLHPMGESGCKSSTTGWSSTALSLEGHPTPDTSSGTFPRVYSTLTQPDVSTNSGIAEGMLTTKQPYMFPRNQPGAGHQHMPFHCAAMSHKSQPPTFGARIPHGPPFPQREQNAGTIKLQTSAAAPYDPSEVQAAIFSQQQPISAANAGAQLLIPSLKPARQTVGVEVGKLAPERPIFPRPLYFRRPVTEHLFYRLPRLKPGIRLMAFSVDNAFKRSNLLPQISVLLAFMRSLLIKKELNQDDANELILMSERIVCHLYYLHRSTLTTLTASKILLTLGLRYLMLDMLVCVVHIMGPAMRASQWWHRLVKQIPTDVAVENLRLQLRCSRYYAGLSLRLSAAVESLKRGVRPGPKDTVELKRELFCSEMSLRTFKKPQWEIWRMDDRNFFETLPEALGR
ncbi:hypothetical protein ETH_00016135 [Eimeria tenella]|uniref:Uncharacterized protein n=1 Tax=Eimeria tenella TaxID=5802 RepID=U6KHX8_EIMTE|nr:hypothetical protein ETH_00016135 [Eimeria tenella]CDJ37549.1 hypothetical protein ETH_00016135 [Eimeria tenella]|eukprot:XP_013228387.1 hypothetical protein ETH_00016135 [Eimeria tenella]